VYDAIASGPRASGPFRLLEDDGAHERVGRTIGMTDDEMAAIKAGGEPDYAAAELDVHRYTRAIAEGRPVDESGSSRSSVSPVWPSSPPRRWRR
jgi:hypothetical protein